MATTWNPSDLTPGGPGTGIVLSNGNLTGGAVGGGGGGCRSTTSRSIGSSGKLYFEFEYTLDSASTAGGATGCGIAASTWTLGSTNTTNAAMVFSAGNVTINNVAVGTAGFGARGVWNAVAIDFTNSLIWFSADGVHWNSTTSTTNDPATGIGGFSIAGITATQFAAESINGSGSSTRKITINFGASAFNYSIPSGFVAWDGLAPGLFSDSVATSDSFASHLDASASISDTIATSEVFPGTFSTHTSDSVAISDIVAGVGSGTPLQIFDGVAREVLESGGSSVNLVFDGLVREALYTFGGNVQLAFAGLVRETLVSQNYNFTNITVPDEFGTIPIFPTLPDGFPVKVSSVMDTTIGTTKSLREMRVPQQQYPLWDIEILFEELRDQTQNQTPFAPFTGFQQYMQLVQNWLMMYGQTNVFGFDCPWDDSRSNQFIGTGDGSNYVFQIYRTWGTGANANTAPVGLVNAVTQVQVNGVTVNSAHYKIIRDKLYFVDALGFVYPPPAGQNVTMTFSYYYLCRFTEDQQDFEEFSKNRWVVPSLKFRAVLWQ